MFGRLLGLLAGLALLGEAFVLWRPDAVGALASPDLGPFTDYRLIIAALAAGVGAAVSVAALMRAPARRKPPVRFDWDAAPPDPVMAAPAISEPPPLPQPPIIAPILVPSPAQLQSDARADLHALEPVAPVHAADAVTSVEPPAPAPTLSADAAEGTRGTFLSAIDAGEQMRAANRLDDALELYDGALVLARRAHAASRSDPTAGRDLSIALSNVADIHDRQGRLEAALALHEESLALRRSLARNTDDLAAQRALSLGLGRLADTREARGHRSRARDLFRERLPLAERLAAEAPTDAGLALDLALTRERLSELDAALAP